MEQKIYREKKIVNNKFIPVKVQEITGITRYR